MIPNFKARSNLPEMMDHPDVEATEVAIALKELEIINTWLGGYAPILKGLDTFKRDRQYTLVDIGSGGGDVLRRVAQWAKKNQQNILMNGVDINPFMTHYAQSKAAGIPRLQFVTADAMQLPNDIKNPDIIITTLFCHHFDDTALIKLVTYMHQECKSGFIINDLHRNKFAYYAIQIITRFFSNSRLVKYDGPLSVARSLTRKEWEATLHKSGVTNYRLKWFWAWRWQIICKK